MFILHTVVTVCVNVSDGHNRHYNIGYKKVTDMNNGNNNSVD